MQTVKFASCFLPLTLPPMFYPRTFAPCSLLVASSLLLFSSCQKEETSPENTTSETSSTSDECSSFPAFLLMSESEQEARNNTLLQYFTPEELADVRSNACLAKSLTADESGTTERAAGAKGRFWAPGATIRVRFLNGSANLQQKVFAWATEWENYADVDFVQVSSDASEVRVLFGNDGHWSYIGTDNANIDACEETMSLQLTDQTATTEIRRVALHEFGHVLGMRHEHQQPAASIPWNTSAVYNYYAQQGWSRTEVDEQVLNKNSAETTQYTGFDASSIMEYPVSASLTTNGFSIGWNTQLSAADKSFVQLMYSSRRIKVRHAATGYNSAITILVAGIYHTLQPGESLSVPVQNGSNTLSLYEQVSGAWTWDNYSVVFGSNYKIVRTGAANNFTLQVE